jgi:hypothetical protein
LLTAPELFAPLTQSRPGIRCLVVCGTSSEPQIQTHAMPLTRS